MPEPTHRRSIKADSPPEAALAELQALAESGLPFDDRSREEIALRLAGYDDRQVAKLLARREGRSETPHRRAA